MRIEEKLGIDWMNGPGIDDHTWLQILIRRFGPTVNVLLEEAQILKFVADDECQRGIAIVCTEGGLQHWNFVFEKLNFFLI
jgi:hypothetical protein